MTTTHLLISLGTTICIGIFLYFYLKKRTEKIEKKVNLMFQLIQEHEKQARQQAQMIITEKSFPPVPNNTPTQPSPLETHNLKDTSDLISVSDGDYEGDSDDSDEVSDNESEKLVISSTNLKAPLALNGAEITSKIFTFKPNEDTNKSPEEEEKLVVNSDESDSDNESDGDNESGDGGGGGGDADEVVTLNTQHENDLDEITLDDLVQPVDVNDESDSNAPLKLDYAEMKEEVDHLLQNITFQKMQSNNETIKQINVTDVVDLKGLKVPELKAKCSELGLEGYKSLRKGALIELLEAKLK